VNRFRWVALQLDSASRCRSLNALRHALSSLPRSLDDTYRRILESIEEQEQGHVRRILQWLCFSKRPLRLEEIAVIYEIADRVHPPFAHDDGLFHSEDIIGICRGLLSLSFSHTYSQGRVWRHFKPSKLRIVQLAHFSVKEYLFESSLSSPWTIDEHLSHVTILKSAIAYYLHFMTLRDIQSLSDDDLVLEYSVAEYFSKYLLDHITPIREHSDLLPSLRLLLYPPSTPIATRFGSFLLGKFDWLDPIDEGVARDPATSLCLAIRLQLPQICQSLLAMNVQLDLASPLYSCYQYRLGDPPLVEAVRYGAKEIIQVLLDVRARHHYNGLDPLADGSVLEEAVKRHNTQVAQMLLDAADDIRETASRFGKSLPLAVSQGDRDLIIALLDAGADPANAKYESTTALISASERGGAEMARILVRAGADVDAQCGQALREASYRNYEEVVHVLLEAGAAVNMEPYGETALGIVSRCGYTKIVKMLLDAGADVDATNGRALHEASYWGHEEVVRFLIEAGAPVNIPYNGETSLGVASRRGCTEIVKALLDAGAGVDMMNGRALHEASYWGHEEVVRFLIEAGAPVNIPYNGETSLGVASHRGCTKIVKTLLDAGADVDATNGRALHEASYWGHEEVVRSLIKAGAAVNMKYNGETSLEAALHRSRKKIVKILLDAGADSTSVKNGRALHEASYWGHEEVVHFLIEAGAAVNMKYNGETSLVAASRHGCMKIVKILLDAGADVNAVNGGALYEASYWGHEEVVRFLIEAGAAVNLKHNGETALEVASQRGRAKIVRMLLAAGVDFNVQCGRALHYACYGGCEETVHTLLEAGADVTMKHNGETALEVASYRGHTKIVQMFLAVEATSGNRSRTQNNPYPSCMVNEDDYDYANTGNDSGNSEGELEEGKGEREEDDEWEETEAEDDDERDGTDVEEDNEREETEVENESTEEDRGRQRKRSSESDETSRKRRKAGSMGSSLIY
jgi:ankyrin repeat protein